MAQVNSILCTGGAKFLNKIYGVCTDGTNGTTKYMRQDGTWQVPPNDQFTLGTSGNSVVLSKNGAAQNTITVPYATTAGSATPTSHTHGNIQNGGTLQTTDVAIASGDKLVITDSSDSSKVARSSLAFSAAVSSQSKSTKFLREDGTWSAPSYTTNTDRYVNSASFADDSTNTSASPVKMTLTRAGSDTATVTANIPKVSSSSAGVVPKGASVSSQTTSTKFLREDGTWSAPSYIANTDRYVNSASFADNTTSDANNPVKMTLTRAGSDTATVTANIPKVSSSSAGVVPKGASVSSQSQSTKFLREDGSWAAPSYPTVNNGTLTISRNGVSVGTFTANQSSAASANINCITSVSASGKGIESADVESTGGDHQVSIELKLKSDTASTLDSASMGSTSSRQYAVGLDKSGYLSVNIPWSDNNNAVTQTATSTNANYEVLFSATADNTTRTEGARKYSNLTFNPSTGTLTSTILTSGTVNADTANITEDNVGNLIVTGAARFLNTINGSVSGTSANVTGTVAIPNGGTGATTAANARANLGTPYMYTDSYPTLLPANGSNNWIKIGTSNTSYGLLPSTSGGAGSGHNYIGTSSWYWKYAYIDEIYGVYKGTITKSQVSDFPSSMTPTSHTHGNITNGGEITSDTAIANGAKIVITDTSPNPKVARSPITFDNSTTNQCLTRKGTWATFTANTGTVTGTGTSGYLAKWNGTSSITKGPQLGSDTTTFLRNDGTWVTPTYTDTKVTQDPLEYSYATDEFHELLISKSAGGSTETDSVYKAYTVKFNPKTMSFVVGSAAIGSTVGSFATILGTLCTASDWASHAEGTETTASGGAAHSEGSNTTASGSASHAEGYLTTASGDNSHAEGYGTTANHAYQHVFGQYNIVDNSSASSINRGNYIEIVGNGTASNALSNARTLDWSGNETIAGNLTLNGSSSDILFTGTHKWDGINASLNTTLGAKLNKSGGEITGTVYSQTGGANFEVYSPCWTTVGTPAHKMRFTATDTPRSGLYDMIASKWAFWKNADGEYQIGPNGYAVQARTQAKGTTKYPLRDGVVFAFRSGASSNTITVACVSQWEGDSVVYQHHVSTINVTVDVWHETIKVANNTNGNIQVIMIGQFNDNSAY